MKLLSKTINELRKCCKKKFILQPVQKIQKFLLQKRQNYDEKLLQELSYFLEPPPGSATLEMPELLKNINRDEKKQSNISKKIFPARKQINNIRKMGMGIRKGSDAEAFISVKESPVNSVEDLQDRYQNFETRYANRLDQKEKYYVEVIDSLVLQMQELKNTINKDLLTEREELKKELQQIREKANLAVQLEKSKMMSELEIYKNLKLDLEKEITQLRESEQSLKAELAALKLQQNPPSTPTSPQRDFSPQHYISPSQSRPSVWERVTVSHNPTTTPTATTNPGITPREGPSTPSAWRSASTSRTDLLESRGGNRTARAVLTSSINPNTQNINQPKN